MGWRASAGPSPGTSGLSRNCFFSPRTLSSVCVASLYSFSPHFPLRTLCLATCPHTYSFLTILTLLQHRGRWIFEIPSLPSVHYCAAFCSLSLSSSRLSSSSLLALCFLPSFKYLQGHFEIDFLFFFWFLSIQNTETEKRSGHTESTNKNTIQKLLIILSCVDPVQSLDPS